MIFNESFDLESAIEQTKNEGYFFADNALNETTRAALELEIESLPLQTGSYIKRPINEGKPNEVRQQHERLYVEFGNDQTPVANLAIRGIHKQVLALNRFPELETWQLGEIGYQRYRNTGDFIGPHRDRGSDSKLSFTFTLTGSALVSIFESPEGHYDYDDLVEADEFMTTPGSLMLLRAPGFGSGAQVIHQVHPPQDSRSILNVRARDTLLDPPTT